MHCSPWPHYHAKTSLCKALKYKVALTLILYVLDENSALHRDISQLVCLQQLYTATA